MEYKKPILILNPVAGPVWRRPKSGSLIRHLQDLFPGLAVERTRGPGDGVRLARAAASRGCDLVLAAGGDGTYNEVINGLLPTEVPIATLPMGTGNSLARELGLPINPFRAAEALRNGEIRFVYLGSMNGRIFILMAGMGFDAHVIRSVTSRQKNAGILAYVLAGIAALIRYPYGTIHLSADGAKYETTSAIVAKARCYGGPFAIAPGADLERPDFELCLFDGKGPLSFLGYTLGVILGRHTKMRGIRVVTCRRIELFDPAPLQADGEAVGTGPALIEIYSHRLQMIFPRPELGENLTPVPAQLSG